MNDQPQDQPHNGDSRSQEPEQPEPPKEPLDVHADDSAEPQIYLNEGQRRAFEKWITGRDRPIGLLDAGAGWVKVTMHGIENEVIDKHLLAPLFPNR